MVSNIHLRGVDGVMLAHLKQEALAQDISVNQLILFFLRRDLGLSNHHLRATHHDLDKLAGTWSEDEAQQFAQAVDAFGKIDEELWR